MQFESTPLSSTSDSGAVSSTNETSEPVVASSPSDRLFFWKKHINQNVKGSYYSVGRAFHQILHKEQLLKSGAFVPWVRENFGLTRSTAYEYIRAYKVVDLLQKVDPTLPVPSTLSHFRVFNKCTLKDGGVEASKVWRRVLEGVPQDCPRLTAKVVLSSRNGSTDDAGDESTSTSNEASHAPTPPLPPPLPPSRNRHHRKRHTHAARDDVKSKVERNPLASNGASGETSSGVVAGASAGASSDDSGAPSSSKSPASEKTEETDTSNGTNGSATSSGTSVHDYDKAYSPKWLLNLVAETGKFTQLETMYGDEAWPREIFCNLLRLFPDDVEFHEQGSFFEKTIGFYQEGKFMRGLFVLEVAHGLPAFMRALDFPHCYLSRKIRRFELPGGQDEISKQAVVIYMGDASDGFLKAFLPHGIIPGLNSWSARGSQQKLAN